MKHSRVLVVPFMTMLLLMGAASLRPAHAQAASQSSASTNSILHKLRAVNRVIEQSAWGGYHTEFYPTYDFKPVWDAMEHHRP
jgi:hypothetical protein